MKKLLLLGILIAVFVFIIKPYFLFITKTLEISPLKTLIPGSSLKKTNDQVNILILGIAGNKHDGPNLSDSLIMATYNFKSNTLTTVGIPRDLWSESLRDRINSAYAYGVAKGDEQSGIKLAKAALENTINYPIHYAAVIDFDKFQKLIDHVGGIDIDVLRSFTDREFPIENKENDVCGGDPKYLCRYETIKFEKGMQHMDGTTALKYVRSRHSVGEEGSDFARSLRQQRVLTAFKDKMMMIFISGDIHRIESLYTTLNESIGRDLTNQHIAIIASRIVLKKNFTQKNTFLPEELFEIPDATDYEGKYVLIPKNNNKNTIRDYITCHVSGKNNCKIP